MSASTPARSECGHRRELHLLGEVRSLLDAIVVRCERGDPRTNWLPTIARLALDAQETLEAFPGAFPVPVGDETEALRAARAAVDELTEQVIRLEAREASLRDALEEACDWLDDDLPEDPADDHDADKADRSIVHEWRRVLDATFVPSASGTDADSGEAGREADSAKNAEIREDLHLAAIACDLYADEFPESIDEEDPERASEALHRASAWLCEQARWSESDEEAVEDERGRSRDL